LDLDLGWGVTLLEPRGAKHGSKVFAPGGQKAAVRADALLLHHKAHVVGGAGVKIALHMGYEGGLGHRRQCRTESRQRQPLTRIDPKRIESGNKAYIRGGNVYNVYQGFIMQNVSFI
jgi:hypothetical protein